MEEGQRQRGALRHKQLLTHSCLIGVQAKKLRVKDTPQAQQV